MSDDDTLITFDDISAADAAAIMVQIASKSKTSISLEPGQVYGLLSSIAAGSEIPSSTLIVRSINEVFDSEEYRAPAFNQYKLAIIQGSDEEHKKSSGIVGNKAVMKELEKPENHFALRQLAIAAHNLGSKALDEVLKKPEHAKIRSYIFSEKLHDAYSAKNFTTFDDLMRSEELNSLIPTIAKNEFDRTLDKALTIFGSFLKFGNATENAPLIKTFLQNPNFDLLIQHTGKATLEHYLSSFVNGISGALRNFGDLNPFYSSTPYPAVLVEAFELLKQNPVLVKIISEDKNLKENYDDIQVCLDRREYYPVYTKLSQAFFGGDTKSFKEQFNSPEFTAILDKILSREIPSEIISKLSEDIAHLLQLSPIQPQNSAELRWIDAFVPSQNFEKICATGRIDDQIISYLENSVKVLEEEVKDRDNCWNNLVKPDVAKLLSSPAVLARVEANPDLKEELTTREGFRQLLEEALANKPSPAVAAGGAAEKAAGKDGKVK